MNQKKLGFGLLALSVILIIILVFVKIQDDKQGAFLCELVAKDPNLTMAECPAHERTNSWLIMAAFGFAFLILASGVYLVMAQASKRSDDAKDDSGSKNRKEDNLNKKENRISEADISKLDSDEKRIYDLLKSKDGSMYQSDIMKETQMSKVKVTRVLDKLEGRHIIERKRRGMTNIVILK